MQRCTTLPELLSVGADEAPVIGAPGTPDLRYRDLRSLIIRTVASLNAYGIGRNDRVAMVLDNALEAGSAFLGVACGATAAPLNPGYRSDEFDFNLSDLGARALIVEHGSDTPAIAVAKRLGIAVIELTPTPGAGAGSFALNLRIPAITAGVLPSQGGFAQADEVALILHTSGSTARPKLVPLTHQNVAVSAGNVCAALQFTTADRGLNIMPLFHIHGLIAGLLAPLSAGSYVFCPPGFNALKFFGWMGEARPSWYTAVPTMHQTILARAGHNKEIIAANPLRFIRSSSSSIPPQVIRELEQVFHAPLIEAYGMTEAAHQMCSNPLPPRERKPGTVGVSAGPEVAIMGEHGKILPPNATGEIVIRGANVIAGYENNPQANSDNFTDGWFRTGDQGIIDGAGYVSITGRLKEIINRGSEKFSPREVDEVLMDHPAVSQVVTFAIPHVKLGEEVGAVVVLRQDMPATERELREFAGLHLADFKVPKKILFMDELPKGPTGKLQRIGLAQKLGLGQTP
ncbi:MAG: AMP-dependent synthetase [Rhodocyclaceae bacterium]|nr:MAG: AMP-dependent synthetase [Rhodocyclaceae bacterium]